MATTKIRKPANKPTVRELFENHQRDSARRSDIETQYNALGHAINAYLIRHTSSENRTDADNAYFGAQFDALKAMEADLYTKLGTVQEIDQASRAAWLAAMDGK